METIVILVFVLGYIAIALEHPIKINKTASAILTGVICWTLFVLSDPSPTVTNSEAFHFFTKLLEIEKGPTHVAQLSNVEVYKEFVIHSLAEHLSEIAQILFFLMGAMTIVDLVDAH